MPLGPSSRSTAVNFRVARACALAALAGGCLSALGWIVNMPRLADWNGGGITIKFNASVCMIFVSLALLLSTYRPRFDLLVRISAGFVFLISIVTLAQTIFGVNFGIDTLIFSEAPGAAGTPSPGRMGVPGSSSFLLLASALILATIERSRHVAALLAVTSLCIASLSITGYLFGADELYALPRLTGIALQTAMMLVAVAVGISASIPEHGPAAAILRTGGAGVMLRLSLPLLLLMVLVFGWLLLFGVRRGYYDPAFGTAIRTLFEIVMLAGVLFWTAHHVEKAEALSVSEADALAKNDTHRRIVETQEAERKRLARDLHDHVGQEVTGLRFTLMRLCEGHKEAPELLKEIKIVCGKMEVLDAEVSNLAWQMRPAVLETEGLVASLRRLGAECSAIHGIEFELHASSRLPDLPADVETNVYRIVQESMNNVVKHANASRIAVTVDLVSSEVRVAIEDDGTGFSEDVDSIHDTDSGKFGLVGMRERAAVVGGTLDIESAAGKGTTILLRIPLTETAPVPRPILNPAMAETQS